MISEEKQDDTITLFGITSYESNADYTGKYAVSATFEKTVKTHSNLWIIGNHWIRMRSSQLKHVFQRKIGKWQRI